MNRRKIAVFMAGMLCTIGLFSGCGSINQANAATGDGQNLVAMASEEVVILDEEVPLANAGVAVLEPTASGKTTYNQGSVILDASNSNQGYIMFKYTGGNQKIKIQIQKTAGTVYTYNLNARTAYEVFPLTEGDGKYTVKVFENIAGTKYAQVFSQEINVKLANQFLPFLYPNQYVNFTANSATVKKGKEITKSTKDDLEKVELVYNYAVNNITYDTAKADKVQSGYIPNADSVLASKKGICFDYASVMAAMLRSQDIPCKLVVGYTGDIYHAWINVYTAETGWVDGMIFFDGNKWQIMDPTFASSGKKSQSIMKYIGDGKNYTAKYVY